MMVFIGESIYFILALCINYEKAVFMSDFNAVMVMSLLSVYMASFAVREGEHLRTIYQKIMYFPVDRKKYLLVKAVPAAVTIGFQIGIAWLVFLCRVLMNRAVAAEVMLLITFCMILSGIWYFLSLLILMTLGERAINLFPIPFILGVCGSHIIYSIAEALL